MREVLVLVNYMRTNPTIVDDLVKNFSTEFKKIYVINRNTQDEYKFSRSFSNVEIREVKVYNRLLMLPFTFISILRKDRISDIKFAFTNNRFNYDFFEYFLKYTHIENLLYNELTKIKEIKNNPDKVSLLSIWFTSEANAISTIKKKNPSVKAISMAHAHEVETFDNKFTYIGKDYCHTYLDKVLFIAQSKMDVYIKEVCNKKKLKTDLLELKYWGSEKIDFNIKNKLENNKIIVSCSTVEVLKRVDLIADSFALLNLENIEWHHFGDGAEMNNLKEKIDKFPKFISSRIYLHGRIENMLIKKFYSERDVELFINVSTTEGLPISVMEALSYRIPVLVTNVGGEREIVDDQKNGYIVDVNINSTQLMEIIKSHLILNASVKEMMRNSAYDKWNEKFNLNKNIKHYIKELI